MVHTLNSVIFGSRDILQSSLQHHSLFRNHPLYAYASITRFKLIFFMHTPLFQSEISSLDGRYSLFCIEKMSKRISPLRYCKLNGKKYFFILCVQSAKPNLSSHNATLGNWIYACFFLRNDTVEISEKLICMKRSIEIRV